MIDHKLTVSEYNAFLAEAKAIQQIRIQKFQTKLMENDFIVADEMAESLLEIAEEFLANE
jgi:hypothetical protein